MEAEHKLTEINKATYEFERDIIRGGVNKVCCVLPTFTLLELATILLFDKW